MVGRNIILLYQNGIKCKQLEPTSTGNCHDDNIPLETAFILYSFGLHHNSSPPPPSVVFYLLQWTLSLFSSFIFPHSRNSALYLKKSCGRKKEMFGGTLIED